MNERVVFFVLQSKETELYILEDFNFNAHYEKALSFLQFHPDLPVSILKNSKTHQKLSSLGVHFTENPTSPLISFSPKDKALHQNIS